MISVFPCPIWGETYESLLTRLGRRTYATGVRPLRRKDVYGLKGLIAPQDFVGRLAVAEWMTLNDLLNNHTLLPMVRVFLDPGEAVSLKDRLARGTGDKRLSNLLADDTRRCPDCERSEFDSLRETSVQLLHQLHWITRCHVHHCMLSDGRDLSASVFPNELLACASTLSRPDLTLLNGIQKSTVWLAKANLPPLGRNRWRAFHRAALTRRFGINPPFPRKELHKVARLVSKRLTKLLWLPMLSFENNWLVEAVHRPCGVTNPLHHIVLLRLCGETTASAVEKILSCRPAQEGQDNFGKQLLLRFE